MGHTGTEPVSSSERSEGCELWENRSHSKPGRSKYIQKYVRTNNFLLPSSGPNVSRHLMLPLPCIPYTGSSKTVTLNKLSPSKKKWGLELKTGAQQLRALVPHGFYHQHGASQLSGTLLPGYLMSSSDLHRHLHTSPRAINILKTFLKEVSNSKNIERLMLWQKSKEDTTSYQQEPQTFLWMRRPAMLADWKTPMCWSP